MNEVDVMLEPLRVFMTEIGMFLPRLAIAVIVLVGGWMLAKLARFAVVRGLRAINFPVLTERAGIDGFLRQGGIQSDMTDVFGLMTYWFVILAALIVAFNGLGLAYVTDLLGRVMLFVPRLFVALLILVFGSYFGRFLGNAVATYCRNVGVQDAHLLGNLAHYAVVTFVVLIALDQMQVGGEIIRQSFLIILAGVVFALALAFGIGGRRWAAGLLERWWPHVKRNDRR
jgi:flagellar biosynthesis protein FliQ